MRNLKKALSLALASVMLLGMMVVGTSAAAYTDVDSADNVEAIEVLQAVGAMVGSDGKFNPDQKVTRNEMAAIMSAVLGLKAADYAGTSPFTDVPAWAEPYVAAAYAHGITGGTSATTYGGEGNITAAQAGLMMMKALGYFQYASDFGDDWQLATVKQASKIDLYDGIDAKAGEYLTRNEIAQLALNALEATMVDTTSSGSTTVTTPDGTTVSTGSVKYDEVVKNAAAKYIAIDATKDNGGKDIIQLGEDLFDGKLVKTTGFDAMGRPCTSWTYKAEDIGTYADKADYTAYVTSTNNTIAKVIDDINDDFIDAGATVTINGAPALLSNGSVGDYVEVYMNANNAKLVDEIVVTHKTVAKLTGDAATKVADDETMVKVPGVTGLNTFTTAKTTDNVVGYEGLVKNDIVLFYADANGKIFIEKAESFTGVLTAAGSKLTIGGAKYAVSGVGNYLNTNGSAITPSSFIKDDATWYVDNDNNIVWVVGEETTELAYVIQVGSKSGAFTGETTLYAKILFTDGTVKTVEYKNATGFTAGDDMFVKYSVKDEVYTLNDVSAYVASTTTGEASAANNKYVAVTKGNPNMMLNGSSSTFAGDVLTNGKTVFFVRDYDTAKSQVKDSYTMYTGYNAVPSIAATQVTTGNNKTAVAYIGSDNYADYVVIDVVTNVTGSTTASELFYVVDNTVTTLYDADGACGFTVKAIKNGTKEIVDLEFATSPSVANASAYIISSYNDDGQINGFGAALTTGNEYIVNTNGTGKADNGTFKLGSAAYAYTADTVVYYIDKDNELSIIAIEDLETDANDTYVAIRASKTSTDEEYNTIKTLFVTQVPTNVTVGSVTYGGGATAVAGTAKTWTASAVGQAGTATVTYTWYIDGVQVGTGNTLTYTFDAAGSYTLGVVGTVTDLTVDGTQVATTAMSSATITVSAAP